MTTTFGSRRRTDSDSGSGIGTGAGTGTGTGIGTGTGTGTRSGNSGSVPAPVDLSDHVSVLRYLHDRFDVGDMETIRTFCAPDFQHFPGSMDVNTPKGAVHPCGLSFIRPGFGFDDFVSQMKESREQMDWGVKASDYFMSPTTSDIAVHSDIWATGKNTGNKISFDAWEAWKFNDKNQVQMLCCLYDPFIWKQVL
jgi:hypothetical protein